MSIPDFRLERYFARWEFAAPHLLCTSDVEALSMSELLTLANDETRGLWQGLRIGWLATHDAGLLRRIASYKDYTTICCSAPSELLTLVALRAREAVLARSLGIVRDNLARLDPFFREWEGVLVLPGTLMDYPGSHFRIRYGRTGLPAALDRFDRFLAGRFGRP